MEKQIIVDIRNVVWSQLFIYENCIFLSYLDYSYE